MLELLHICDLKLKSPFQLFFPSRLKTRKWSRSGFCATLYGVDDAPALTVDRDAGQDDPGGPLGQVFDEDERHEGADHDEVGLLQLQRTFPVDADHPHCPEVPDNHAHRRVIHRHVVRPEHLPVDRGEGMREEKKIRCCTN